MKLSILTPAFNEAANLPALYERLVETMRAIGGEWEWVVVDDHSRDETFTVIEALALRDARVRGFRLARNSGSHVAIMCGLHQADGDAAVMIAADLQDPPETLATMVGRWRQGAQVVWATRRSQSGDRSHQRFAALYYWVMRHVVGMKEMPARGADFFLIDRVVLEAFRRFHERNVSVLALITWLGFRQEYVEYDKQPRKAGQSGWTLSRKIKLVVDSITSFSDFPIRLCTYAGLALIAGSLVLLALSIALLPEIGGGVLFLLFLIVGLAGLQLVAVGVVGEYVWRGLDESRRRPPYLIEAVAGQAEHAKLP
ncbi:MAG TPA: glycosyltransferase family 2 protein [Vicinamibacterales bacterium]|nr:glycosyltransferase family 2 protein [Vicinamibacterales bacterium]